MHGPHSAPKQPSASLTTEPCAGLRVEVKEEGRSNIQNIGSPTDAELDLQNGARRSVGKLAEDCKGPLGWLDAPTSRLDDAGLARCVAECAMLVDSAALPDHRAVGAESPTVAYHPARSEMVELWPRRYCLPLPRPSFGAASTWAVPTNCGCVAE